MSVSVMKVLAVTNDLAGIGDIVSGAIGIKEAKANGDTAGIVGGSLQVAGGSAMAVAGLVGTAGLWATVPANILRAVSGLSLVGSLLALGGMIALEIVQLATNLKQLKSISDDQGQWFQDLANDGLADPEWANKLEYYSYAWTVWGNDNTDTANQSYTDFQSAEWDHFNSEAPTDVTSLYRLESDLHVHTHWTPTQF